MDPKKYNNDISSNNHSLSNEYHPEDSSFLFFRFLKKNSHLFAIIGITGTLLALLPNFMDKIVGADWKLQLLSNDLGVLSLILFQTCIISGVFFILYLAEMIIIRLFDANLNEKKNCNVSIISNPQKITFLLLFCLPIFSLIFFISTIFFVQEDIFLKFFQMLINFVIVMVFALISIITISLKFNIDDGIKHGIIVIIVVLFLVAIYIVFAGYLTGSVVGEYKGDFVIYPDKQTFNPTNSLDMGIKFDIIGTSQNQTNFDALYRRFTWSTNYGYFIVDDSNSSTILTQDRDITLKDFKKVYWSYDFHDVGLTKPPVKIYLNIWDEKTKKTVIGNSTNIIWLDKDTAFVQS